MPERPWPKFHSPPADGDDVSVRQRLRGEFIRVAGKLLKVRFNDRMIPELLQFRCTCFRTKTSICERFNFTSMLTRSRKRVHERPYSTNRHRLVARSRWHKQALQLRQLRQQQIGFDVQRDTVTVYDVGRPGFRDRILKPFLESFFAEIL